LLSQLHLQSYGCMALIPLLLLLLPVRSAR
jgi:hypothetical protein